MICLKYPNTEIDLLFLKSNKSESLDNRVKYWKDVNKIFYFMKPLYTEKGTLTSVQIFGHLPRLVASMVANHLCFTSFLGSSSILNVNTRDDQVELCGYPEICLNANHLLTSCFSLLEKILDWCKI